MMLNYFSPAHILYIVITALAVLSLYFILRKKTLRTQKSTVLFLMLLNVFQHIFKLYIYPQYGGGFNSLTSAYNMCALLILISPIAYISKSGLFRDFVFYSGSAAGTVAILIPYWNIGTPAFSWEIFRFLVCHILLLVTSILPLLLGHHRPSWKCFYKVPLCFFAAIAMIVLNDIAFIYMGLYPGADMQNLYDALAFANPVWSFGPPETFAFVKDIAMALSPNILVGENSSGRLVPILWYFIPLYLGLTLLAFPICAISDRKNFISDMKKYRENLTRLKAEIKNHSLKSAKNEKSSTPNETDKSNEVNAPDVIGGNKNNKESNENS